MEKKDNMNLEMFIIISNITSLNLCDTKEPLTQSVPVILPSCGNFSYNIISDVAPEHISTPDSGDIDAATIVHSSPCSVGGAQLDDEVH